MDICEIIEKVGEAKLREAMEKDDAEALKQAFSEAGVEITDEQLDYIAGGMGTSKLAAGRPRDALAFTPGFSSCYPD